MWTILVCEQQNRIPHQCILVISQKLQNVFLRLVHISVAHEFGPRPTLNQRLCEASINFVKIFYYSGLNCPFPA